MERDCTGARIGKNCTVPIAAETEADVRFLSQLPSWVSVDPQSVITIVRSAESQES